MQGVVGGVLRVIGVHSFGGGVLRVGVGRGNEISPHDISLACPSPIPFEVTREKSEVGMSEDAVKLRENVRGVSLERLLHDCPVRHSKQQCVLVGNGYPGGY